MKKITLCCFLSMHFILFPFSLIEAKTAADIMVEAQRYYWGNTTRQDYKKALELYEQAAKQGDPEAQFITGGMYYTGKGTEPDLKKAFEFLTVAAEQGKSSPQAQMVLAEMYVNGEVVPQNYVKALNLFTLAAEAGLKDAQNELGFMYYVGKGVDVNFDKALEWFEKAALQGNSLAQFNTGMIFYLGNSGRGTDLVQSYAWFSIASASGNQGAAGFLQNIEPLLTQDELQQAQQVSNRLYRQIEMPKQIQP